MTKVAGSKTGDITGYILWDEPDEILRVLSAEYIALCFEKLSAHVRSIGANPRDLRFGWLHPGVAVVPSGRESPLSYVGWLWDTRRPSMTEEREAAIAEQLLVERPQLRWAASYRSGVFECAPEDSVGILQAIRDQVLDDPSAGDPDWIASGAGHSSLLRDIVEACRERDRAKVMRALERAAETYSVQGADLLRISVLLWLDSTDETRLPTAVRRGSMSQQTSAGLPASSNFHLAFRGKKSPREIARMYSDAGWSSRACGWNEFEISHPMAELVIEGKPAIMHGAVGDPEKSIELVLAPIADVDYFCECYAPDGSLLLERDNGVNRTH